MHYENGDEHIDVAILAEGVELPELGPGYGQPQNQTWIAVKSNKRITAMVELLLNASQFQVDFMVDGVVRNIYVSTACPSNQVRKLKFEFIEAVHKKHRSLYRTLLMTSNLKQRTDIPYVESDRTSVGAIEIFVYKYEQGFNHLRPGVRPEEVIDWEDLQFPPGTAGITPTHEIVFPKEVNDQTVEVQLGDTGRRTWRRKAERPVMGNHPVAAFKFLYRHESSLRNSNIIDPRRHILPTGPAKTALRTGLSQLVSNANHNGGNATPNTTTAATASNRPANPYAVTEKNGLRIYEEVILVPDKPGPQMNSAQRRGRKPNKKRARSTPSRDDNDDLASGDEFVPSHRSTPAVRSAKKQKKRQERHERDAEVEAIRAELAELRSMVKGQQRVEAPKKNPSEMTGIDEENHTRSEQTATPGSQEEGDKTPSGKRKKATKRGKAPAPASTRTPESDNEPMHVIDEVDEEEDGEYSNPFVRQRRRHIFPESLAQSDGTTGNEAIAVDDDDAAAHKAPTNGIMAKVAQMLPTHNKMAISQLI